MKILRLTPEVIANGEFVQSLLRQSYAWLGKTKLQTRLYFLDCSDSVLPC